MYVVMSEPACREVVGWMSRCWGVYVANQLVSKLTQFANHFVEFANQLCHNANQFAQGAVSASLKGSFHNVEGLCKRHQGIPARKEEAPMDKRKDIEVVTRNVVRGPIRALR